MASFSISIELGEHIPAGMPLNADTFPHLAAAVRQITLYAHERWVQYAMGAPLPNGLTINNRTGEYARSIMEREIGPFAGIVESHLPYARAIEEGSPARDMKRILNTSLKVRLSKTGARYLIIPLRADKHSGLPDSVANWWQQGKTSSSVTGTYRRQSGTGAYDIKTRQLITVPGWRYAWGDRLKKADLAGLGVTGQAAKRLEGMVRFANPGGKAGGGAKTGSHSQLVTFRVMSERSRGWIAPAQPGKFPARTVADQVRPLAAEMFKAAVQEDIKAILGGG